MNKQEAINALIKLAARLAESDRELDADIAITLHAHCPKSRPEVYDSWALLMDSPVETDHGVYRSLTEGDVMAPVRVVAMVDAGHAMGAV